MRQQVKTTQLQIRVTSQEKLKIRRAAKEAGVSVSAWVLARIIPSKATEFQRLISDLANSKIPSASLAAVNEFLSKLSPTELIQAVENEPQTKLSPFLMNYVAAMIEQSADLKTVSTPSWVANIKSLPEPYFASTLDSLRAHLLTSSPPPYRKRNLFVDSSIGDRV